MESNLVSRVTVLMTVYDEPAGMLKTAIDSILAQTFADFELLILDDGSRSLETRAALERSARKDHRICLRWEPHRGLPRTANLGLKLAQGELIARQDADDWSEPARLERQVAFFDRHPEIGLCGSDGWTHQQNGEPLWKYTLPHSRAEILEALWQRNPFTHGSTMFRREAALAIGGYQEEFPCGADYDFCWRLAEQWGGVNLPEPLYHYRYRGGSVTAGRAAEQSRAHRATLRLAASRERGEKEDVAAALDRAGEDLGGDFRSALKQADHLMLAGKYSSAWRHYVRLARARPASALAWGKIARWAAFVALPPAREACFRGLKLS
jgi:glycosyltransferase involved in cell wall biosynthesis